MLRSTDIRQSLLNFCRSLSYRYFSMFQCSVLRSTKSVSESMFSCSMICRRSFCWFLKALSLSFFKMVLQIRMMSGSEMGFRWKQRRSIEAM